MEIIISESDYKDFNKLLQKINKTINFTDDILLPKNKVHINEKEISWVGQIVALLNFIYRVMVLYKEEKF